MKKHISIFLIATLLLTAVMSFGSVALAADPSVVFEVKPSRNELSTEESVTFEYSIVNNGSTAYSDCGIYVGTSSSPIAIIGNLNAGSAVNPGSFKLTVSPGQTLTFHVKDSGGSTVQSASVTIAKKAQNVKLAATTKVSRTLAGQGNVVDVSVTVENQGDVDITGIVIRAAGISNNPLSGAFDLRAGRSHTIKHSYTMGSKDVTFTPTVDFNAAGVAQQRLTLEPITIMLESRSVDVAVVASNNNPQPGEEVTFTLTITNNGNVPYTDLNVLLNGESVKAPASSLNKGETLTGTYTRSFQTSTEVFFTLTLKDHTGAVRTVDSNKINVRLPVDPSLFEKMQFTMTVDRPQLTSAGVVNFTGSVVNATVYALKDISVSEETFGNIFSQPSLEQSGRINIEWSADINQTTEYKFVLTFTDADGNQHTVLADPITVTIQALEETPDFDDAVTLDPDKSSGLGTTGVLLIIAGVLVLLIIGVGVALFVLWKKGQSSAGRKRPSAPAGKAPRGGAPRGKAPRGVKRPAPKSYRDRNNF